MFQHATLKKLGVAWGLVVLVVLSGASGAIGAYWC